MTTLSRTCNLGIKVTTLPRTHDLIIRISNAEEIGTLTTRPPSQPMEREKFVEYKASASDSQVGPINLKLLPAILEGMGILKSIWLW